MKELYNQIIALHQLGKRPIEIVRAINSLKFNRKLVYRTIKRFSESGSIQKRYRGGHCSTAVTTRKAKKVRMRLARNLQRSARKMTKELEISSRSLNRILKSKLGKQPLKLQNVNFLSLSQKKVRQERAKALKMRHASGELREIVFFDENIFTV